MKNRELGDTARNAEINLATDLIDQFSEFNRALDKQKLVPEVKVSEYTFQDSLSLYSYPPVVRDYLDLMHDTIEKVVITAQQPRETSPGITIQIHTTEKALIELTAASGTESDSPFRLRILNTGTPTNKTYEIDSNAVSHLLISMALPPTDNAEILKARGEHQTVVTLNPRDPQVLYLIENSLDNQAVSSCVTQKFEQEYPGAETDDPTHFTLVVVKNSRGDLMYDTTATSHAIDGDTISSYDISVHCTIYGDSHLSEDVLARGTQTRLSIDRSENMLLDQATVISYMSALIKRLMDQR